MATRVLSASIASLIAITLMSAVFFPEGQASVYSAVIVPTVVVLIATLIAKAGHFAINLVLLGMSGLAVLGLLVSHTKYGDLDVSAHLQPQKATLDQLEFRETPNVYLVHLESYNNREAMRSIYNFDNTEFETQLERIGFSVPPNSFSNYRGTLAALLAIYGMKHHYHKWEVGNKDAVGARAFIGGKTYNPVFSVFANNGYKIQTLGNTIGNRLYAIPGDAVEFAYPPQSIARGFDIYQVPFIDRIVEAFAIPLGAEDLESRRQFRLKRDGWRRGGLPLAITPFDNSHFGKVMRERIKIAGRSETPYFTVLNPGGTSHSKSRLYWHELDEWERRYPELVEKANPVLLDLFDTIVREDPEAVVIAYGDHGATRYRKIALGDWVDGGQLNDMLDERGVTVNTVALDQFGSILAVRYPGGDAGLFDGATHVNLFQILFSELSGDTTFRDSRAPDHTYFIKAKGDLWLAVRDGEILDTWEKHTD